MLDSGEGCKNSLVGIHGQSEWVVGKSCTIYGPVYELVTCVSSCSEGSSCALLVRASTFYGTHSRVVGGGGNIISLLWKCEGILACCWSRNHFISSMRHSVNSDTTTSSTVSCISGDIEVVSIVPSKVHQCVVGNSLGINLFAVCPIRHTVSQHRVDSHRTTCTATDSSNRHLCEVVIEANSATAVVWLSWIFLVSDSAIRIEFHQGFRIGSLAIL